MDDSRVILPEGSGNPEQAGSGGAPTDAKFLAEIKKRAAACMHADQACDLVYFINNTVNAKACWRSWSCVEHGWGGHGAVPNCPVCRRQAEAEKP